MDAERWQRVAHLYESVLGRQPGDRAAFLAEQSAGDEDLRCEVESLLAHDRLPVLIDQPMLETAAAVLDEQSDLKPGAALGPYRIDDLLGAGGMGQVYRAIDTRLNRTVAIKVLPRALAGDPQFRARFDREAHAIATLTHPHICTLYDIGQHEGVDFLVMEYLEGETLAARLEKGRLSVEQALSLGVQIADALAAAHGQGIVHRDLKPGNIILTKSGAKLLDFGLAKPAASAVAHLPPVPTMSPGLTAQGTILGTLQYMAPEQLEGKEADPRTDIFAFGAVLYQMLTGKNAFEGKSHASVVGAIMHEEPPAIAASQPLTPPAVDRLVKTCLAKEPDGRWQSARDVWRELQWIVRDPASGAVVRRKRERLAWSLAPLLIIGAAMFVVVRLRDSPVNPAVVRFTVNAPADTSLPSRGPFSPQISPDGKRLVFMAVREGGPLLALRSLDALETHVLPGTEGARFPFWSPDSHVVAFFVGAQLKKIDVSGGPVRTICEAAYGLGGTWNRDDVIVFTRSDTEDLYRVPAAGGQPTPLALTKSGKFQSRPQFLPDHRRFLYFVEPDAVYLASLDGNAPTRLPVKARIALYAPPGYLLFSEEGTLVAQRFDSELTTPLGDPMPLAENVVTGPPPGSAATPGGAPFSVSENGVLAYATRPAIGVRVASFDRTGRTLDTVEPLPAQPVGGLELSPDAAQIAMQSPPGPSPDSEIWLFDLARRRPTQLTFSAGADRRPIWSPDGRRLVFASRRREAPGLYQKLVRGQQPEELLLRSQSHERDEYWPSDWSPKGIVYESGSDPEDVELWMLPLDGARKPYPLVSESGNHHGARVSPDGRWLAYQTMFPTGSPDVVVQSLTTPGAKWRISTGGASSPRWRGDGKELFYLANDGRLIAVPIEGDSVSGLRLGTAQTLFQTAVTELSGGGSSLNVSPDGQRFLISAADSRRTASIVVVSNWPAMLKP
jgi:Tol biopolymer transport system component